MLPTAFDHSFGHAEWPSVAASVVAAVPSVARWLLPTWQELAAHFTDRFLRDALRGLFDLPNFPALLGIMILAWQHARDAGYPVGGSLRLARAIEARYLELGGEVTYNARVDKILTEGGRAVGVRLDDGSESRADIIISCADGHATIFEMLDGRFVDDAIRRQYVTEHLLKPLVQVSLGVAADFSDQPPALSFPIPKPISIAARSVIA